MNEITSLGRRQDRLSDSMGASVLAAAEAAVQAIPPAWPLAATVAVNPFLGQATQTMDQTAARLGRIAGLRLALPRRHVADKIAEGVVVDADLIAALRTSPLLGRMSLSDVKAAIAVEPQAVAALPTVADLAARATGQDWPGLIADRIGAFAAGYFDEGQALWAASRRNGLYAAWRAFATHDLTPDILGLNGFGSHVADTPETAQAAIERAAATLRLQGEHGTYFHQLLLTLGGWAQCARHLQFKADLEGDTETTALEFLAIRLVFEEVLYLRTASAIDGDWQAVRTAHAAPVSVDRDHLIDDLLLTATERAAQRRLAGLLATPRPAEAAGERPRLQAAFCIDVRSEVFRRSLESVDPGIRTLGFAGFFGLGVSHRGFASDVPELRLPVLLKPSAFSCTEAGDTADADRNARFTARAVRAWGRFKLAAVSSFAFVEAMGPIYAAKLLRDSLGFIGGGRPHRVTPDKVTLEKAKLDMAKLVGAKLGGAKPCFSPSLDLDRRAVIAETVLRAMSLTEGFARHVLIAGHGANVVNNPFASSLQCGACGGHAGDVNARLLADLLNDDAVRDRLAENGIHIPDDTVVLAGLHDTTTDRVTVFANDPVRQVRPEDLAVLDEWLWQAGQRTRAERAARLPSGASGGVLRRSRDWAEVRPELGLAGCNAFIAAPRARTAGLSLDGKAFLHDYRWEQDDGFRILELILTAPVVVASWISLQYFGSVVAPSHFGSGNKLLHNVVGGMGVVEGNGGNLRAGLPWQSVHDGAAYVHEPLRLTVLIEAPRQAVADILQRHPEVQALFDNGWLHLLLLDEHGHVAWRYARNVIWTEENMAAETVAPGAH